MTESGHGATLLAAPEPRRRDYTIISVDDHLVEPAHLFEQRLSAGHRAAGPRVVETADGIIDVLFSDTLSKPTLGISVGDTATSRRASSATAWCVISRNSAALSEKWL